MSDLIYGEKYTKWDRETGSLLSDSSIAYSLYNNNSDLTTSSYIARYENDCKAIYRYEMGNEIQTIGYSVKPDIMAWKEYDAFATGNYSVTNTSTWGIPQWNPNPFIAPGERMRQMIRDRMSPAIRVRKMMPMKIDEREVRARQTLRRIIGEQAFRKFIRDGFITVVPKSGLTYRIFSGHGMTQVYDRGIMVDRLCVVLQGQFPPTDSLIMRYLLILNDEGEFSKYAVKHQVLQNKRKLVFPAQEVQPLVEAWAKLKVA